MTCYRWISLTRQHEHAHRSKLWCDVNQANGIMASFVFHMHHRYLYWLVDAKPSSSRKSIKCQRYIFTHSIALIVLSIDNRSRARVPRTKAIIVVDIRPKYMTFRVERVQFDVCIEWRSPCLPKRISPGWNGQLIWVQSSQTAVD